jgi:hypothetical protein
MTDPQRTAGGFRWIPGLKLFSISVYHPASVESWSVHYG